MLEGLLDKAKIEYFAAVKIIEAKAKFDLDLAYNLGIDLFEMLDDHKMALKYAKLLLNLQEKTFSNAMAEQTTHFQAVFEFQKHTKEKEFLHMKNLELNRLNTELNKQKDEVKKINKKLVLANHKLADANETKNKLFSLIAHDIRNPINSLLGIYELLTTFSDKYTQKEKDDLMVTGFDVTKRLHNFTESILEWSKLQSTGLQPNFIHTNLLELVTEEVYFAQKTANIKNIAIVTDVSEEIEVNLDQHMIASTIRNFLNNAIKFSHENSEIRLCGKIEEYNVIIEVIDNGIGMSDDVQAKLFNVGERVTTLGTNNEKGFGLGLIMSRNFIELHNGRIEIDSEKNKGTTMRVVMPYKMK
jgi:signal transduction histidine kinase